MISHPLLRRRGIQAARSHADSLGHCLTPFYDEEDTPRRLLACCKRCGRRVKLSEALTGDALTHSCDGDGLRAVESRAWLTGQVPRLLLKRFIAEVEEIARGLRRFFDPGDFQPDSQQLVSEDRVSALVWYLREQPDLPIDKDNPQSPGGFVELERWVPQTAMLPARYIDPRRNPNLSEERDLWMVLPLETGTHGLAYPTREGQWCFRRTGGVVGHPISPRQVTFESAPPATSTT